MATYILPIIEACLWVRLCLFFFNLPLPQPPGLYLFGGLYKTPWPKSLPPPSSHHYPPQLRLISRPSLVSLEPSSTTRRKIFSPSSLQLNLNCVREERREPLLRPLGESEDSFLQMISARTPLIEADSDRESCV